MLAMNPVIDRVPIHVFPHDPRSILNIANATPDTIESDLPLDQDCFKGAVEIGEVLTQ